MALQDGWPAAPAWRNRLVTVRYLEQELLLEGAPDELEADWKARRCETARNRHRRRPLLCSRALRRISGQKRTGHVYRSHYQTRHLQGATIGIVGLGGIGREVARFARGFSMRVVATRASIFNPLSATPTALT